MAGEASAQGRTKIRYALGDVISIDELPLLIAVERAIRDSDLGVNPATSGDLIRVPTDHPGREAAARVERVLGIAYYAVARPVERDLDAICRAACAAIRPSWEASSSPRIPATLRAPRWTSLGHLREEAHPPTASMASGMMPLPVGVSVAISSRSDPSLK